MLRWLLIVLILFAGVLNVSAQTTTSFAWREGGYTSYNWLVIKSENDIWGFSVPMPVSLVLTNVVSPCGWVVNLSGDKKLTFSRVTDGVLPDNLLFAVSVDSKLFGTGMASGALTKLTSGGDYTTVYSPVVVPVSTVPELSSFFDLLLLLPGIFGIFARKR